MPHLPSIFRTLALAALVALTSSGLRAQSDGPPPGPPPGDMQGGPQQGPGIDRQLKHLTKLLTLTTDQQAQAKTILTDEHQQIKALFDQARAAEGDSGGPPSPETRKAQRTQINVIRDAANAKISALLTDEQKAKFAAWLDKQKQREAQQDDRPGPPDGGGPGGGGPSPGV